MRELVETQLWWIGRPWYRPDRADEGVAVLRVERVELGLHEERRLREAALDPATLDDDRVYAVALVEVVMLAADRRLPKKACVRVPRFVALDELRAVRTLQRLLELDAHPVWNEDAMVEVCS